MLEYIVSSLYNVNKNDFKRFLFNLFDNSCRLLLFCLPIKVNWLIGWLFFCIPEQFSKREHPVLFRFQMRTAVWKGSLDLPARCQVCKLRKGNRPALVSEVWYGEDRQCAVYVPLHGGGAVSPIRGDWKRPVVNQAWDHIGGKSNDHGLHLKRGGKNKAGRPVGLMEILFLCTFLEKDACLTAPSWSWAYPSVSRLPQSPTPLSCQ